MAWLTLPASPRSPTLVLPPPPSTHQRLLWAPTSGGSRHHPRCTDADSRLCIAMVFSWSSHPSPGKGIHGRYPLLLASLHPAGLAGGSGLRNGQAQGSTHSPIVWVPPPAPWGFRQVAHPLTHTGEGGHPVPTLWLWEIWWDQQAQHGSVRLSALVQPAPSCAFQAHVHPWLPLLHPCPGHLGGCDVGLGAWLQGLLIPWPEVWLLGLCSAVQWPGD